MLLTTKSQHVFVDESGDPSLDITKEGVRELFVLSAIIVNSKHLEEIEQQTKLIIEKYCQSGELKSNRIKKTGRREVIIKSLTAKIDFKLYALVVDKKAIFLDSGLQYKKSFLKFLNGRLYSPLYKSFNELHVKADEHGRSEFMESFAKYIKTHHSPILFEQSSFQFVSSKDTPLVQVADLFAGTLSRCYSGKDNVDLINLFSAKTILIEQWPPSLRLRSKFFNIDPNEKNDFIAREQGVNLAKIFIEKHENEIETKLQVETLKYLLYQYNVVNPVKYVPAAKIISHLDSFNFTNTPISDHVFKTKIIAKIQIGRAHV